MGCREEEVLKKASCLQGSVPQVDNTELECDEFVSSKCVYLKDADFKVDGKPYPTLNDYLIHVDNIVKDLKKSNVMLLNELDSVKAKLRDVNAEMKTIQRRITNVQVSNV